jgi:RNA polymerase sigma-70 factor (ECF subfamily)
MRRADQTYGQRWLEAGDGQTVEARSYADLRDALASLSGADRAILSFCYEDGFSTADIAEILAIPPGTVKSRLHYARQRLRRFIEEHEDE